MRSANETRDRESLNIKVTILIVLWIFDKLIMLLMLWFI